MMTAERRSSIQDYKDKSEIPLRLRLFKRAKLGISAHDVGALYSCEYKKLVKRLHAQQCKNCPMKKWGGTIFTRWDEETGLWW